jgi:methylated-DNA-[protein]-cysteine S-methyltransferase
VLSGYTKVRKLLGGEGASDKIAHSMINELTKIKENDIYTTIHKTPLGNLRLTCNNSALISVEYNEGENLNYEKEKRDHHILAETIKQLDEYFQEKRRVFDLPVELKGTDFQRRVWEELRKIPYGQVKTYGEIASVVETKDASRAVGLACKMNPLLIVVPCHRVLGVNNKLTGFAIGIDKKSFLLDLERAYLNTDNSLFK